MDPLADERVIRGQGTPESAWRAWLGRARVPPLEPWPSSARVVVVAPHPDDEVLACGGLLARHAQSGGLVAVIAVTDGEASHGGQSAAATATLAAARRAESARGLAQLGVPADTVQRLGFPDGGVTQQGQCLQRTLHALLRPGDWVVTTWCLDGHPDHEATGEATRAAAAAKDCRLLEAPVWTWHWAEPGDARIPWERLRRMAVPAALVAAKMRALAEHASQLDTRRPGGAVLGTAICARARRSAEYYFIEAG